ncbi:MAG: matrixin family metalloprotease [Candidatus Bathyarchaeales archaeon]
MRKAFAALVIAILLLQAMAVAVAYASPPDLEQHIFIHYAKGAKPKPPATDTGYYKLLGAKWKVLPVKLEVNPTNEYGLSEDFVKTAISLAAEEWDDGEYSLIDGDVSTTWSGVSAELVDDTISINYSIGYGDLAWSSDKLDGKNTILWGNYEQQGVIAVTIIWSNRFTKAIVEFDMVLNTDFEWGNATESGSGVMDLQNIVTHELGHGLGLGDVYVTAASQETMYGYASYGETIKRSLYKGDMTGITKLYGP